MNEPYLLYYMCHLITNMIYCCSDFCIATTGSVGRGKKKRKKNKLHETQLNIQALTLAILAI